MQDTPHNAIGTASAAARAMLLFLAVFGFAAMWDGDHAPQDSNWLAERARNRSITQVARHSERSSSRPILISDRSGYLSRPELPAEITPGRYRVVDHTGDVQTLLVTEHMLDGSRTPGIDREFYTLTADNRTRYYIRLTTSEVASATEVVR